MREVEIKGLEHGDFFLYEESIGVLVGRQNHEMMHAVILGIYSPDDTYICGVEPPIVCDLDGSTKVIHLDIDVFLGDKCIHRTYNED